MKRLLNLGLLIAASLGFAGCGVTSVGLTDPATAGTVGATIDATGAVAPAPLAKTLIDEKGVLMALQSTDVIATGVDRLVAAGVFVPGSPKALTIRSGLVALRTFLKAASAAQKAGNANSYAVAMTEAAKSFREIAAALNST